MAIFAVSTKYDSNDAFIKARIVEYFPEDHYEIGRGQWLIAFPGTAQNLYKKLFPEPELPLPSKGVTVFGIAGYYGHASRDMWEWMATKLQGTNG